ncbi:hypothetical protein GCM10010361_69340 [Streptomyces olivaceiscleroticus]|uniref:Uncharacterized protein n=1 Tax=Streptomyces olivaceiscleroticus TaxID=68245 RepID=A0ABP3L6C3_9ACTN
MTALTQASGAYRGRYASIIGGYRGTGECIDRHRVFVALDVAGRLLRFPLVRAAGPPIRFGRPPTHLGRPRTHLRRPRVLLGSTRSGLPEAGQGDRRGAQACQECQRAA